MVSDKQVREIATSGTGLILLVNKAKKPFKVGDVAFLSPDKLPELKVKIVELIPSGKHLNLKVEIIPTETEIEPLVENK